MKLIIAGSRSIKDKEIVREAFEKSPFEWEEVDVLVSGSATGVDRLAEQIASECDKDLYIENYPVSQFLDVVPFPELAPLERNEEMAEYADALLAVQENESSGTQNMIENAKEEDLKIYIEKIDSYTLDDF